MSLPYPIWRSTAVKYHCVLLLYSYQRVPRLLNLRATNQLESSGRGAVVSAHMSAVLLAGGGLLLTAGHRGGNGQTHAHSDRERERYGGCWVTGCLCVGDERTSQSQSTSLIENFSKLTAAAAAATTLATVSPI